MDKVCTLQLATNGPDGAWICTLCYAFDNDLNIYWMSRHSARHSGDIAGNKNVAAAIAMPFAIGDKSRGIQIQGEAHEITDNPELSSGMSAMGLRYQVTDQRNTILTRGILAGSADFGLYKLVPRKIFLTDTISYPDIRQEYTVINAARAAKRSAKQQPLKTKA